MTKIGIELGIRAPIEAIERAAQIADDNSVDADIGGMLCSSAKTGIGINKTNAIRIIITGFILQFSLFF